jgi:hypothetical protein
MATRLKRKDKIDVSILIKLGCRMAGVREKTAKLLNQAWGEKSEGKNSLK